MCGAIIDKIKKFIFGEKKPKKPVRKKKVRRKSKRKSRKKKR